MASEKPSFKTKTMAKLNVIAEKIREKKRISLTRLCMETDTPFSTMQYYKPLLLEHFKDLSFSMGEFYVKTTLDQK